MKKLIVIWTLFFALLLVYGGYQAYQQFKIYKSTHISTEFKPGAFRRF